MVQSLLPLQTFYLPKIKFAAQLETHIMGRRANRHVGLSSIAAFTPKIFF